MAFAFSRAITIDPTKCGSSDSSNFPVLIKGTYAYLATTANGGQVTDPNGYDIGFYSDAALTSKLSWETDLYTAATGVIAYWVKVPTVSHTTNTVIYMAYSNPSISSDQSAATSVWDSNYKAIYHLSNGSSLSATDSTGANNGTITGATATTGQIDGGALFDNGTNKITIPNTLLTAASAFTISWWENITSDATNFPSRFAVKTTSANAYVIIRSKSATYTPICFGYSSTTLQHPTGDGSMAISANVGTWNYFVVAGGSSTVSATSPALYFNGASQSLTGGGGSSAITVNQFGYDGADNGTNASIDEVRISSGIARGVDWALTEYNNQSSPTTFYTVGAQRQGMSGLPNNFQFVTVGDGMSTGEKIR